MDKKVIEINKELQEKINLAKEACVLIKEREELLNTVIADTILKIDVNDEGNIVIDDEFFGEEVYKLEDISSIDKFRINGDPLRLILEERENIELYYGRMPIEHWIRKIGFNYYSEKRTIEIYENLKIIENKAKAI